MIVFWSREAPYRANFYTRPTPNRLHFRPLHGPTRGTRRRPAHVIIARFDIFSIRILLLDQKY